MTITLQWYDIVLIVIFICAVGNAIDEGSR